MYDDMKELNDPATKVEPLIKDIQTVLSVSYVIAVAIGMLFNYQKFSAFGINIFEYADVLEFLVVPFSDVVILLFTLVSVIVAYFILRLDLYWERKFPKAYDRLSMGMSKKNWYGVMRYGSVAMVFVTYLYMSSSTYAKLEKRNLKRQPESVLRFIDNELLKGIVLGKTKDVLSILSDDKVRAVPMSAVKDYEVR
jgi:hypothetical protein